MFSALKDGTTLNKKKVLKSTNLVVKDGTTLERDFNWGGINISNQFIVALFQS